VDPEAIKKGIGAGIFVKVLTLRSLPAVVLSLGDGVIFGTIALVPNENETFIPVTSNDAAPSLYNVTVCSSLLEFGGKLKVDSGEILNTP
jgi:hypothetical protein